jgi:hypothetical protein
MAAAVIASDLGDMIDVAGFVKLRRPSIRASGQGPVQSNGMCLLELVVHSNL